jgi:molybdopterin/thiamine biosynthesis adenylyltransferase
VTRSDARIAIIGMGGLGTPAALALAHAGIGSLLLIDDDVVDETNLHRQILYRVDDVGRHKLDAARDALVKVRPSLDVEVHRGRLHPGSIDVLARADVVLECSDRYAVKFLAADAARLLARPIVHGAAIRWVGTAMATAAAGSPCYRCLFEDLPGGAQQSCDVAGVVGPVCGIVGALQAHLALRIVDEQPLFGALFTVDGLKERVRSVTIPPRPACPLCGTSPTIAGIEASRYVSPSPSAPLPAD